MNDYKDMTARIRRIQAIYEKLHEGANIHVTIGTAIDGGVPIFYACVGQEKSANAIRVYRPTVGGALVAVEMTLHDQIEKRLKDLQSLTELQNMLAETCGVGT